jgi:hypothetical protein
MFLLERKIREKLIHYISKFMHKVFRNLSCVPKRRVIGETDKYKKLSSMWALLAKIDLFSVAMKRYGLPK